jgi:N utilization substance protein B
MDANAINARKRSRRLALQALYQWLIAETEVYDLHKQFMQEPDYDKCDKEYLKELIYKVIEHAEELRELLTQFTDRPIEEIDPIECSILYIAFYELKYRIEIPYRAVINEAINLTKKFGATDGFKFVNGVLDRSVKQLRPIEFKMPANPD